MSIVLPTEVRYLLLSLINHSAIVGVPLRGGTTGNSKPLDFKNLNDFSLDVRDDPNADKYTNTKGKTSLLLCWLTKKRH